MLSPGIYFIATHCTRWILAVEFELQIVLDLSVDFSKIKSNWSVKRKFLYVALQIKGQRGMTLSAIKTTGEAVKEFRGRCGRYPPEKEGLQILTLENFNCPGWYGPLLQEVPKDGWGRELIYSYKGIGSLFDIISYGADGLPKGIGFYNEDYSYQQSN